MYTDNGINGPCGECEFFTEGFTEKQKLSLHPTCRFRATLEYNDGWCSSMNSAVKRKSGCDTRPRAEIFDMLDRKLAYGREPVVQ